MKFKYTALGASNQKLEGVLEAESLDVAREELHKMGLSVVAINEVSAEEAAAAETQKEVQAEVKEGIPTFYFLAKDPLGKEVNGTIDSKDANAAYRRLLTEYRFDVLDLYPQNAVSPATESSKSKFEEWKSQMEDEGIDLTQRPAAGVKEELEEEGEKMNDEIVAEIDHFIINTKKVLNEHPEQYSEAFLKEIEKTLNELERIRASNNLKHITKVCNNLYELISNPDVIEPPKGEGAAGTAEATAESQDYTNTVSQLKDSGFVTNRFQFMELHNLEKKAKRFERVQTVLAKVYKTLNRKKADQIDQNLISKIKRRRASWASKLNRSLKGKGGDVPPTLLNILSKFFDFVKAPNIILRRARKQDMAKALHQWKEARRQKKIKKAEDKKIATEQATMIAAETTTTEAPEAKKDFSGFFMELDSFVGWLLFFYIAYFFLVNFAIEKNVGLSKELVLKTFTTPLIINISIFLIVAHIAFTLKLKLFRSNFLGSLFLFFFCFGIYTIVVINF